MVLLVEIAMLLLVEIAMVTDSYWYPKNRGELRVEILQFPLAAPMEGTLGWTWVDSGRGSAQANQKLGAASHSGAGPTRWFPSAGHMVGPFSTVFIPPTVVAGRQSHSSDLPWLELTL